MRAEAFHDTAGIRLLRGFVVARPGWKGEGMHRIEILGSGCPRCHAVYRFVKNLVEREHLDAEVIEDVRLERLLAFGILAEPGVVVDGELVCTGRMPEEDEVRSLLGEMCAPV